MAAATYRCPQGHPISAADRFDMFCRECGGDTLAIGPRLTGEPPEYEPDLDDLAAARQAAMETPT